MAKRSRSDRIYGVIIGGKKMRFFRDLTLLCELLHLDYAVVRNYLYERGWWHGMDFTVISGEFETRERNFGKY